MNGVEINTYQCDFDVQTTHVLVDFVNNNILQELSVVSCGEMKQSYFAKDVDIVPLSQWFLMNEGNINTDLKLVSGRY